MPSLVEIGSVILEKKKFKISSMYFSLFHNYLPLAQVSQKGKKKHFKFIILQTCTVPSEKCSLERYYKTFMNLFCIKSNLNISSTPYTNI